MQSATLAIGPYQITALTDAQAPFPHPLTADRVFPTVPAGEWDGIQQRYPASFASPMLLLGHVTCYLIRSQQRTILIDTGMGRQDASPQSIQGALLDQIAAHVALDAIDTVFMTHLHVDHVSWNMQMLDDRPQPTFPRARYVAPQGEWAMCQRMLAAAPEHARYISEQIAPLVEQGRLALVEGPHQIADGITAIATPGHSPAHMSVAIEPGAGERLLIAGDAFYHPLQVALPQHHFGNDADPATAHATRVMLLERCAAAPTYLAACHFPAPSFGRVQQHGSAFAWEPLAAT